ncbi:hypothetical protein M422DRAFT_172333, partial [Sphaerobolus stellatus SS14]
PYFQCKKKELGRPEDQECLLQIDVWLVHRSKEFRGFMSSTYPWIILDYVPGGCTGLWQPCNLGIQRPIKLSIKHSQHADIVEETLKYLCAGHKPEEIKLNTQKHTFRDRSPAWLLKSYHAVNRPEIIKKLGQYLLV